MQHGANTPARQHTRNRSEYCCASASTSNRACASTTHACDSAGYLDTVLTGASSGHAGASLTGTRRGDQTAPSATRTTPGTDTDTGASASKEDRRRATAGIGPRDAASQRQGGVGRVAWPAS
ncbi:MAG: hypothetical protein ACTS5I_10780 [Rhodanobacter sp.]